MNVKIIEIIKTINKGNDVNKIINITDEIKNALEPSKDLLNNFVAPYLMPIIAARESEILIIKREVIAIPSLNKNIVIPDPINTQEAPVILHTSLGRVIFLKNISAIKYKKDE
tara:strand:+ start:394 stop:732 length:339 start_codon:yes stop_codon:yes gene_type:complete